MNLYSVLIYMYKTSIFTTGNKNHRENNLSILKKRVAERKRLNQTRKTLDFEKSRTKTQKARIIQKAFRQSVNTKLRPQFLSKVCPDSSECLMLGSNRDITMRFFEGFSLKYTDSYQLINSGANGSILKIKFNKHNYNSYGVIKISIPFDINKDDIKYIKIGDNMQSHFTYNIYKIPDNMIYEYLVGLYLNEYVDYLPNFLETYQLFKIKEDKSGIGQYKQLLYEIYGKDTSVQNFNENFKNILSPVLVDDKGEKQDINYVLNHMLKRFILDSCNDAFNIKNFKRSYTYLLMTQYMREPFTLHSALIPTSSLYNFMINHLIYILFQIYYTLHIMNSKFAHYDLHTKNVILYQPYKDGYIEYFYYLENGEIIQFKSPYIVKIIDYGRCYIEKYSNEIKKVVDNSICHSSGYMINTDIAKVFHMYYNKPNNSNDLRLFDSINRITDVHYYNSIIYSIFSKVVYGRGIYPDRLSIYGTLGNDMIGYPYIINNVSDAFYSLTDGVLKSLQNNQNRFHRKLKKKAEFHIYGLNQKYDFIDEAELKKREIFKNKPAETFTKNKPSETSTKKKSVYNKFTSMFK
jgi:hypothetical protein